MKLVIRNRIFFLIDLLMWVGLPALALLLAEGRNAGWRLQAVEFAAYVGLGVVIKSTVMYTLGVYRRYWLYASIEELLLIARAVLVAGVVTGTSYVMLAPVFPGSQLPWQVPVLDGMLTLVWVGGARLSVRLFEYMRLRRAGISGDRALIVGAGDAGTMIARELASNPQIGLHPVGFIDDNPAKLGARILGLEVLGNREALPEVAADLHVSKVVIAIPTAPGTEIRAIREICEKAQLETKTMPGIFELLTGRVRVNAIRDVQIEDLLRRPPVETDRAAVRDLVRGATVMVTGAGGSVGSEIARQVARLGAGRVCLLGHGENSVFDIDGELRRRYAGVAVTPIIADIRDADRLRRVFHATRPDLVFHAAAHKHVPLMEQNPEEAITNNVFGTQNVLVASENVNVRQFVFISTDKAVEPANVMGATKRIAEGLVQHAAARTGRPYVAVRFGNVLASRGSVVPLFQKQILEGGPITVTHPDVTRFFMTIPEAVQLVLQAAALGTGGEVFVLDMGEPVKITDLARDLIRLSGLEPDRDVAITFTGLRAGEKLTEELFDDAESQEPTAHPKVLRVRNGHVPFTLDRLEELRIAAHAGDWPAASRVLNGLLPGWPATTSGDARPDGVLPLRPRRRPSSG